MQPSITHTPARTLIAATNLRPRALPQPKRFVLSFLTQGYALKLLHLHKASLANEIVNKSKTVFEFIAWWWIAKINLIVLSETNLLYKLTSHELPKSV